MEVEVRVAAEGDDAAIATIYNHYVLNSTATFEIEPIEPAEIARRRATAPRGVDWLVACLGDEVVGYAYIVGWKARAAYADTVECSVYVATDRQRAGIGGRLYDALLPAVWDAGFHAVLAGICLPNPSSVRLHEARGFRRVGVLRQVGWKFQRRIDVGYWELLRDGFPNSGENNPCG